MKRGACMIPMSKKKKLRIVLGTYACALIAALGIFSYVSWRNLRDYRLAARYSAQEAFEETVAAVDHMSAALKKSVYATDGGMCVKICSQVYADALAAEAAMATLPFSTQELEQISGYINQVGDYAYTLCAAAAPEGFTDEQAENLASLSDLAEGLSSSLRELHTSFHNGSVTMDSSELTLRNVGADTGEGRISAELLRFESEFPRRAALEYDGRYGVSDESGTAGKKLSDAEKLAMAASFAGVSPAEVRLAYDYEGVEGRKCYSAGDMLVCVGPRGVESMGRSSLISESRISAEKAQEIAFSYLESHGFEDMALIAAEEGCGTARMKFASTQDGALCLDNFVRISVALDDGSIYAFNAESYSPGAVEAEWNISEQQALSALPESLTAADVKKVVIQSDGGRSMGCYELDCTAPGGGEVKIFVDAVTGRQAEISVDHRVREIKGFSACQKSPLDFFDLAYPPGILKAFKMPLRPKVLKHQAFLRRFI